MLARLKGSHRLTHHSGLCVASHRSGTIHTYLGMQLVVAVRTRYESLAWAFTSPEGEGGRGEMAIALRSTTDTKYYEYYSVLVLALSVGSTACRGAWCRFLELWTERWPKR